MAEEDPMNQCNVVHTLRSGKKVDNQVSMPSNPIQYNHTQVIIRLEIQMSQLANSQSERPKGTCLVNH